MDELWENEQFFFDKLTIKHLAEFIKNYENPCLLCAPMLGRELEKQGINCYTLDIDRRFSNLQGFHYFNIKKPKWNKHDKFGIILCDPPFFKVEFSHLFKTIKILSQFDFKQPLLVSYLTRHSKRFLKIFTPFNLKPTGYHPSYKTVGTYDRNEIEFYGNISKDRINKFIGFFQR